MGQLQLNPPMRTIAMLIASNVFMTFAWYRHLKAQQGSPLWAAILVSWGIAFFEYCIAVPANRWGYAEFNLPQLKLIQEIVTLLVFAGFASTYMGVRFNLNHLWAAACLVGAVFFAFRG
jgi:uncharacterized protein (DUF486 family)